MPSIISTSHIAWLDDHFQTKTDTKWINLSQFVSQLLGTLVNFDVFRDNFSQLSLAFAALSFYLYYWKNSAWTNSDDQQMMAIFSAWLFFSLSRGLFAKRSQKFNDSPNNFTKSSFLQFKHTLIRADLLRKLFWPQFKFKNGHCTISTEVFWLRMYKSFEQLKWNYYKNVNIVTDFHRKTCTFSHYKFIIMWCDSFGGAKAGTKGFVYSLNFQTLHEKPERRSL